MRAFSLTRQDYLRPPLWSKHLTLGRFVISMSVKNSENAENLACLSNRLADLRREQGMTRRDLAYGLQISEATLVAIEQEHYAWNWPYESAHGFTCQWKPSFQ